MSREDWFRSELWDDKARTRFEEKLARTRSGFHRAQYLRIKGLTLTETGEAERVDAGRELLQRVIAEHRDEALEVSAAHYALAESYIRDDGSGQAIHHLRACLDIEAGANVKHGAELLLAEALITSGDSSTFDEAWRLLAAWEKEAVFGSEFWRIEVARARLLARTDDRRQASMHAQAALRLLETDEATFARHPTVGRIEADQATVREMRQVATS